MGLSELLMSLMGKPDSLRPLLQFLAFMDTPAFGRLGSLNRESNVFLSSNAAQEAWCSLFSRNFPQPGWGLVRADSAAAAAAPRNESPEPVPRRESKRPRMSPTGNGGPSPELAPSSVSARPCSAPATHRLEEDTGACAICLEDMRTGCLLVLPCLHTFHRICGARWLNEHKLCPLCKALSPLEQCVLSPATPSHQPIGQRPDDWRERCKEAHLRRRMRAVTLRVDVSVGSKIQSFRRRASGPVAWRASTLPCAFVRAANLRLRPQVDTVRDLRRALEAVLPRGLDSEVDRVTLVVEAGSFVFRRRGWVTPRATPRAEPLNAWSLPETRHAESLAGSRVGCRVQRFDEESVPLRVFGLPCLDAPDCHPAWGWAHESDGHLASTFASSFAAQRYGHGRG
eukprot:CAMPEP_0172596356 /NCGR_PEP_ID=MMETSP1068-20121228/16125_1 /TAXON_ID=35684 /ORGANISM="Pseudopedinella elastica, Strain CCMP716" /LENGTH=397 /DNA_ID=CAMNT_0013395335 /DNA_START=70 /DNA_END=1259 /DNA_ORIENTATION=+